MSLQSVLCTASSTICTYLHDQTLFCNLLLILFACNLQDGLVTEFQLVHVFDCFKVAHMCPGRVKRSFSCVLNRDVLSRMSSLWPFINYIYTRLHCTLDFIMPITNKTINHMYLSLLSVMIDLNILNHTV